MGLMLLSKFASCLFYFLFPEKGALQGRHHRAETGNGGPGSDPRRASYLQPESQCWKVKDRLVFACLAFLEIRGKVTVAILITLEYADLTKIQL